MNNSVAIIDYGLGNLFSILKACERVGIKAFISNNKKEIENSKAILLPGVGAYSEAMKNLNKLDLVNLLKYESEASKPIMGICLGMQLLLDESEEFGNQKGLGIISGYCKRFPNINLQNEKLKVPQIMWNTIAPNEGVKFKENTPLDILKPNEFMYFVHSYYAIVDKPENILSKTNYCGIEYTSSICKNNVSAFQFHPEKSAKEGLKIYERFKELIKQK